MRRRRYNKRKPEPRREKPVMIECMGDVPGDDPIVVILGNEQYHFLEDPAGRLVAAVALPSHIECFLARTDMYRAIG